MRSPSATLAVLALAGLVAGCKTAPDLASDPASAGPSLEANIPARELLDVCWPSFESPSQQVTLNFLKSAGRVQDIVFDTSHGLSNGVGRCAQEIAWLYPWPPNGAPDSLTITPPPARPSGWVYLAYLAMVNQASGVHEEGIDSPAPLVRACLQYGSGQREHLRYRVRTRPVHVTQFTELSAVDDPDFRRTEADLAATDTERCVQAVLASASYSRTRNFEFEFSDLSRAPAPAPERDVAMYFDSGVDRLPTLRADEVKLALSARQPAVAACWNAALKRRAGLSGGRSVHLRIRPDGSLSRVTIVGNESDVRDEAVDYLLDRCLVDAIAPAHFGAVTAVGAQASYSWVFAVPG